jgi:hypothetical protein
VPAPPGHPHHQAPPDTSAQEAGVDDGGGDRGGGDTTEDDFLALVAHFDDEPRERDWPEAEDIAIPPEQPDSTVTPPAGRAGPAPTSTGPGPAPAGGGRFVGDTAAGNPFDGPVPDAPGAFASDDGIDGIDGIGGIGGLDARDDADEGHYTPPPPPPVPRMRPVTRWALGSIALGVAILFAPAMFGFERDGSNDVVGVFLILGGVGTLVARLGERRPTGADGPDDGAVV